MSVILNSIEQYFDLDGSPLQNGYLYFGETYGNPVTNPVVVYFDPEYTIPAAQPVRTVNGYPVRSGTATGIYAPDNVSILVQNSKNEQVIYIKSSAIEVNQSTVEYRETNQVLTPDDNSKTIFALEPFTQTLSPAATLGDRWFVNYYNFSSGLLTIEPFGSETINGQANLVLGSNQSALIYSNGISFSASVNNITNKNIIINPEFYVNNGNIGTAYVIGATLASGQYGHEMWRAGASGGDYSYTSSTTIPNTLTIASGKTLIQNIEPARVLATNYILSWTGTAQARVGVNSTTPSGGFATSPIFITGQTIGQPLSIEFNSGTLSMPTLNAGNVIQAMPSRSFDEVLFETQRYAYKHDSVIGTYAEGATSTATALVIAALIAFPRTMRAIPAVNSVTATYTTTNASPLDFVPVNAGAYLRYSLSTAASGERAFGQLNTGFIFFTARV